MSARRRRGLSFIEVLATTAIIGLLAALALGEFQGSLMRARRAEAQEGLSALDQAQQYYFAQHGEFAASFGSLDWKVEGGEQLSETTYRGKRYVYELSQPFGSDTYYCAATADLDADPWPDVLEIYDL